MSVILPKLKLDAVAGKKKDINKHHTFSAQVVRHYEYIRHFVHLWKLHNHIIDVIFANYTMHWWN